MSTYGSTTGTADRAARRMMEGLMVFELGDELAALRDQDLYRDGDRNSVTLAKEVDFRVLLTALRAGASLDEQDGDARASLQILDGTAELTVEGRTTELHSGQVAVVDAEQAWQLNATSDCALLLTLAWPRSEAGV